jgi:hypothetical protein
MKKCTRCEKEKDEKLFSPGRLYCNKCHAEYVRQWREENPEKSRTHSGRKKNIVRMSTNNVDLFKVKFDNGTEADITEEKFDELFETINNYGIITTNGITTYTV